MKLTKGLALIASALLLTLAAIGPCIAGGKGRLVWKSFAEGTAEAQKSNKKMLIDVYTDWCGWCKQMDARTYADNEVISYLENNYVVIKLNAESSKKLTYNGNLYTEQELAAAFGITGFPSTLFLKSNGEPITVYPGFAEAERFRHVLAYVAEDHFLTIQFHEYLSKMK